MTVRTLLKDAGLSFCLGLGHLLKPQGIPILVYHSIDNSDSNISISPEIFAKQMGFLKAEGFRVISLSQFMSVVHTGTPVRGKTVVLTFDDGLKNFYTAACPILKQYGFSATIFVPTDFIGKESWWYADYGLKPLPMLDWQEIRELAKNGMDIQSHGCSHRNLTGLTPSEIEQEVRKSKKILEQGLSKPVDFFCYPFGEVDKNIIEAIQNAGYKGATCTEQGLYKVGDDPYLIKRQGLDYISIVDERTALLSIKACTQGTFGWYVRAKRRLKRLRFLT
ncbi:MAG: polysaccharide deacetylase family protein [Nitrospirota bacterium]